MDLYLQKAKYFKAFPVLVMICIIALFLLYGAVFAEDTVEDDRNAVLVFSSFDGGGFEYSIDIDNPEIVTYTGRKDYGSNRQEFETGSPYQVYYTFSGLKPGSTKVTIFASSPIIENYEMVYQADVDENLKVTLTTALSISRFELYLHGDMAPRYYSMYILQNEPYLSVGDNESYRKIDQKTVDELAKVFETYDVASWNGFSKYNKYVLDGEGFRLEIYLSDGSYIYATGDNSFPEHYHEVIGQWEEILNEAYTGSDHNILLRLIRFLSQTLSQP